MSDEVVVVSDQTAAKYMVDGKPIDATSCEAVDEPKVETDSTSMSFNLQTSGLAVQINTTTPASVLVVDLQAKLEFALIKLSETEAKLEAAMRRIGFLEAQLEINS